jgi:glucose/arabinose dehydrogenase
LDAYELGWLRHLPHAHDIPGYNIVLDGVNVETIDPFSYQKCSAIKTGAFVPFGTLTHSGQHVKAGIPFTAGIMRCDLDGTNLETVAWGIRNAYGLGFLSDGRLLATEQGPDDRGSRPIGNAPDLLFEIKKGCWYGWPDFIGGEPVTNNRYVSARGKAPTFVLADHAKLPSPEKPLLQFPPNSCPAKFDVITGNIPEWKGHIVVALFGDEKPMTAPQGPPVGRTLVRVDPADWSLHQFMNGPFLRPIDVRFDPNDDSLYVLDFGQFEIDPGLGIRAHPQSGSLWRIRHNNNL